jgi:hypothetical protein
MNPLEQATTTELLHELAGRFDAGMVFMGCMADADEDGCDSVIFMRGSLNARIGMATRLKHEVLTNMDTLEDIDVEE